MIKWEIIVSDGKAIAGDIVVPPGQRVLKLQFNSEDLVDVIASQKGGEVFFKDGTIYVYGKVLAAFERQLRQSRREEFERGKDG